MHLNADLGDIQICAIACLLQRLPHYGCFIRVTIALVHDGGNNATISLSQNPCISSF